MFRYVMELMVIKMSEQLIIPKEEYQTFQKWLVHVGFDSMDSTRKDLMYNAWCAGICSRNKNQKDKPTDKKPKSASMLAERIREEEKNTIFLLCNLELVIPGSKKSKCDFCGRKVFYNTEEKHDKKICPACLVKRPKRIDEFRLTKLTKEAKKEIENRFKPKFTAI